MNKDKKEADSQILKTNYWLPWGEGTGKGQDGVGKFFKVLLWDYMKSCWKLQSTIESKFFFHSEKCFKKM